MTDANYTEPPRRGPGRPRREAAPEALARLPNGRIQVKGRDGVVLARKRSGNTDPYAIPPDLIPEGWDYQWNTYTVAGQQAVDSQILMAENGWRPVPAERHAGMFMPEGHTGQILRGGLRLEERPLELTLEAREEEKRLAVSQVKDQNAQLGMGTNPKFNLGRGHEPRNFLGGGQAVRTGLDQASDAPRPRLEIDQ